MNGNNQVISMSTCWNYGRHAEHIGTGISMKWEAMQGVPVAIEHGE